MKSQPINLNIQYRCPLIFIFLTVRPTCHLPPIRGSELACSGLTMSYFSIQLPLCSPPPPLVPAPIFPPLFHTLFFYSFLSVPFQDLKAFLAKINIEFSLNNLRYFQFTFPFKLFFPFFSISFTSLSCLLSLVIFFLYISRVICPQTPFVNGKESV